MSNLRDGQTHLTIDTKGICEMSEAIESDCEKNGSCLLDTSSVIGLFGNDSSIVEKNKILGLLPSCTLTGQQ